ncbi:uncharacterized protein LOC134252020 [Saccostrea cucullata]|uniref:uncharacterized protein LOC134252020 n=1 Tax=Saccostrea cuccullata TaxID=36930 RepID=UPI002ED3365D
MMFQMKELTFCVLFVLVIFVRVETQDTGPRAFLKCPTARAATFMYFADIWTTVPEPNTDYDSLNCGNVKILHGDLEGRCGVCGDFYNAPRHNEIPNGKYAANRQPTYLYREGSVINVTIEVSENGNGGYYIFKLCNPKNALEETQSCFDETVLSLANSPNVKKIYVPKVNASNDIVVPLQLPTGFSCKLCTMQWTWVTNVDEGCEVIEGTRICGKGLGPQTTLVNCADISIIPESSQIPTNFAWPDFTSKYDTMTHKEDKHHPTVQTTTPKLIIDRKEVATTPPKNKPTPARPIIPRPKRPYLRRRLIPQTRPTIPPNILIKSEKTPETTKSPTVDKKKYKKGVGGLAIGLLELLIPSGLMLGLGGMLYDRYEQNQQNTLLVAQPGMMVNGGVGINPAAAEHRVLVNAPLAAGGLTGVAGIPTAGAPMNPVPIAGLSPVLTGMQINDAQMQQIIPLIPVLSDPQILHLIPENRVMQVLIPLMVERRRLIRVFPHFTPDQITQMHLQYHAMQRQGIIDGGLGGQGILTDAGQGGLGGVMQGQSGFSGITQGQGNLGGVIQGQDGFRTNAIMNQNFPNQVGNQQRNYYTFQGNQNSGFFEMPQGHSFTTNTTLTTTYSKPSRGDLANPELEFDREPGVVIERETKKSPYSKNCPPEKQVCKSKFTTNEPTIYGSVSIMKMICEMECSDGKPSCPAVLCICACPEGQDGSLMKLLFDVR